MLLRSRWLSPASCSAIGATQQICKCKQRHSQQLQSLPPDKQQRPHSSKSAGSNAQASTPLTKDVLYSIITYHSHAVHLQGSQELLCDVLCLLSYLQALALADDSKRKLSTHSNNNIHALGLPTA
jgi:hypothetical protein